MPSATRDPPRMKYASVRKIMPSTAVYQSKYVSRKLMLPSSATVPATTASAPMKAMNCQADRIAFWAFQSVADTGAGGVAPAVSFGVQVGIDCAGAIEAVVAHMSQLLLPSGMAQPQRLQTAIAHISPGDGQPSVTVLQQETRRQPCRRAQRLAV